MKNILQLLKKHENMLERQSYKKGETLFIEGDECTRIGIVNYGEISIKSFFSNGKEVVYNSLHQGQMFGNNLIFSSNPHYRGDVVAESDCDVFFINKELLMNILQSDTEFLKQYLTEQSDFSKTLNLKIKLLTIPVAQDRLIYYLTINKGKIYYKSVTKLADELYLARESLSRTIKKLKENKVIKVDQKTITLMVD